MSHSSEFQFRWFVAPSVVLNERAARLYALLPQHQCRLCEQPDCAHYAKAVADGTATPDRCQPGGASVAKALRDTLHSDTAGVFPSIKKTEVRIDADHCIGCTRCLQACPIDALIGAPKRLHAVVPQFCSGCGLCLEVCPVDCMKLLAVAEPWTAVDAEAARQRYALRQQRLRVGALRATPKCATPVTDDAARRQDAIAAALAKARARRQGTAK